MVVQEQDAEPWAGHAIPLTIQELQVKIQSQANQLAEALKKVKEFQEQAVKTEAKKADKSL